jgi:murein L,D-transpeptidase YafK
MKSDARVADILVASVCCVLAAAGWVSHPVQAQSHGERADSILIVKHEHVLELLENGKIIRTYKVALGRGGLPPKQREGDERTPEGRYVIDSRNAASHYYKALHISYPNAEDRVRATGQGIDPGGAIMIHGLPNGMSWLGSSHRLYDWTQGCVAVTDAEMDAIWDLAPVGTPVEIRP